MSHEHSNAAGQMNALFSGGTNIALKAPHHRLAETVRLYHDVLGLPLLGRSQSSPSFPEGSPVFGFNGLRLLGDDLRSASRSDPWLQVRTADLDSAMDRLRQAGVRVRDELEPLLQRATRSTPNSQCWVPREGATTAR
jgi:hypothetical protein